ncbi:SDR family NAD(P)-dependent oxidoreductase [Amycolatopsis acidicola]|uniref:SDR family NAD(P)-dependent oxidoreductase n=1 Tax=Amycolatopsis acidicola TaxID=2596893 RepID=A0A5N0UMD1_9PSEU|nr:type I polyketide synthase [Amycolatopsis acidicola]KAA9151255.1 SDR family NAD(P)-dependent oxidoreductase [Amycolatopsis acidicola]
MSVDRRLARNPIAIVGMSGLFPMARNHREYWQNIVDGTDCTEDVPESRWSLEDYYDADPAAPDKTYSRRGAFLPDVDFDPVEFGLPPNQLEVTSTMQTLSLGVARDLLRDAGADGEWYDPARTGVVLGTTGPVPLMHPLAARLSTPVLKEVVRSCGLSDEDADAISAKYVQAFAPWEENSFPGLLANVVAGRVANRLGLGGMNSTVDAACAASLSAIRTAIAELVDGRADTMITGGVDTENTIFIYLCFSKVGALSKSGRISPFDDNADGTLLGEGIGMLALRRLEDAQRDGNRIYAVIRGLGSSSDGRSKSIYAPRAEGQRVALERAYADAECSPASVELFEAHATGTAVGDKTELTALGEVLREAGAERHGAALGSVKSQIGHTKGAAGTASLMKIALGLYHKVLPPTINVEQPNHAVDLADGPYYVNVKTRPWIRDPERPARRAAASAMGFGGTNFHLVLEEHDHGPILHRTPRVHLWHASDVPALLELLKSGAPSTDGADIPASHARVGFVATDDEAELRELAISQLSSTEDEWSHPRGVYFRRSALPDAKVGALFAGQGSQYLDMGLEAALNNPRVADTLDEANAAFAGAERRLAQVMFPAPVFDAERRQEQESALRRTDYAQPAIGALAAGQFRFLRELGLECAGYLGHSFGELTALWASGALSDVDFFKLARARGQAMVPVGEDAGTMAAISAGREQVTGLLAGFPEVVVCNHNAPDQVVVGGGTEDVAKVIEACTERGLTARQLPVAAAFHTKYVGHAVEAFRPAVESVHIGEPGATVYANSPGASYGGDPVANGQTLVGQLLRPVEFVAALEAMKASGCTVFVEFGPKQVLTSLVRRTLGEDVVAIPTDAGPLGDSDVALKQAALRLAVLGAPLAGINRYDAPALEVPKPKGHEVTLSAPEYVPAARRAAYQNALTEGYRVALPEQPVTPPPAPVPVAHAAAPAPAPAPVSNGALQQHITVHNEYLEGQLRVAEQLAAAIRDGGVDASLADAVNAVKDQSVAIGQAHTRANEILATLAELELGGTGSFPTAAPSPLPASPVPASPLPASSVPAPASFAAPAPLPAPEPVATFPSQLPAANVDAELEAMISAPATGLRDVLLGVVAEKTGYPVEMIDPSMDLEADLGVDSIKRVQVLGAVQEKFPGLPDIGPEQLGELRTLDQILTFLGDTPAPATAPATGLRDVLLGVVAEKTGYPVEMIDPSMDLEADLGVDSIKRVQVLGAVQEKFPGLPDIGPEQLGELRTLDQILTYLEGAGDAAPKAPEAGAAAPRHRVELVALPAIDRLAQPYRPEPVAAVFGGDDTLVEALEQRGWTVHRDEIPGPVDLCLVVLDGDPDWAVSTGRLAEAILIAKQAFKILTDGNGTRRAFVTLTRLDGELGWSGTREPAEALVGGVGGLVKTLAAEAPQLFCRAVDLHPALPLDALLDELDDAATDTLEVGVDAEGNRCTVVPSRHAPAQETSIVDEPGQVELGADELLVVSGGGRGVTALCVKALAERSSAEFLLLGRTALTPEPEWASGAAGLKAAIIANLPEPTPREVERVRREILAQREIRETLAVLGTRARYLSVDVTDAAAVEEALAEFQVTGFVHGAGVLADALIADKTPEQIERVFSAKLAGAQAVLSALDDVPLRHLLFFTSVAGLLGNSGQADYATANEALCRVAASWKARHPEAHVTAIDWGAWDGGMVTPELRELFTARGVPLLDPADGTRAFVGQFTEAHRDETCVLVGADVSLAEKHLTAHPAFTAYRDLGTLPEDPVIQAHRIGGHAVLPATFGLGWLINVLERAHPGRQVVEVRDYQVHKGIVFDGELPADLRVEARAGAVDGESVLVRAAVRSAENTSHYAATFVLGTAKPSPNTDRYTFGTGEDGLEIYRQATQFHGPRLQGMHRILERTEGKLVLECRLADEPVADGAFGGRLHSPVLADLLLQGPPVLGKEILGGACLPLGIGLAEYFAQLPDDQPFVLVLDDVRKSAGGVTVTATASDGEGRVLQRFAGVTVVSTPDLTEKFREAVRGWLEETE